MVRMKVAAFNRSRRLAKTTGPSAFKLDRPRLRERIAGGHHFHKDI